jgi:hypothetical protein
MAYARRKRHGRTFSEDERIRASSLLPSKFYDRAKVRTEAASQAKKVEDDDLGVISEPEDPLMLARDAKDWKVRAPQCCFTSASHILTFLRDLGSRPLRRPRPLQTSLQSHR